MKNKILTLTKKLMRIHSTANHPAELSRALEIMKQEIDGNYTMENFESNGIKSMLVHNTKPGTKRFKIILNAHLDVVPGKTEHFQPAEKNGRLYGRGAYDMKAAAAVMTLVFKEVANKVTYPLAFQVVTDEEVGSEDGMRYQLKMGVRGDFVINGECGSNMKVGHKAKGLVWLKLTTKGQTSHGAYLWEGKNALLTLLDAIQILRKKYPTPTKPVWKTTMNIAKIETPNITYNKVPDEATAYLDIRYIEENSDTIIDKVKKLLPENVAVEVVLVYPLMFIDEKNGYLKLLLKSIKQATGKKGELHTTHATSEIPFYNEVGCAGVEFGIVGGNQHTDNEWIDIKELEHYYQTLYNFLLSCERIKTKSKAFDSSEI